MLQMITEKEKIVSIFETDLPLFRCYMDYLNSKAEEFNIPVYKTFPRLVNGNGIDNNEYIEAQAKWQEFQRVNTISDFAERELGLVKKEFKII